MPASAMLTGGGSDEVPQKILRYTGSNTVAILDMGLLELSQSCPDE